MSIESKINIMNKFSKLSKLSQIPLHDLWGWFKHDEGSGETIIDYSPLAINGIITGTAGATQEELQAIFWSTLGFGHSKGDGYPRVQTSRIAPAQPLNYTSGVFFVKPLHYAQEANPNRACMVGEGGNINFSIWGWNNSYPTYWVMTGPNTGLIVSSTLVDFNKWYCVYFIAAPYSNYEYQLWIRKIGEKFIQIINAVHQYTAKGLGTAIYNFGPTNQGCYMDGGDFLIYASDKPSGCISLYEANIIYELLKERYKVL